MLAAYLSKRITCWASRNGIRFVRSAGQSRSGFGRRITPLAGSLVIAGLPGIRLAKAFCKRITPLAGSLVIAGLPGIRLAKAFCKSGSIPSKDISTVQRKRAVRRLDSGTLWQILGVLVHEAGLLLLAVASAVLVALLNIQIPLILGDLINVVAKISSTEQLQSLRPYGFKLLIKYAFQASLTFLYITLLSVVGERMAHRLRVRLFQHYMLLHLGFFDSHRVGDLLNRLINDANELKSAFKLCVSQGLRCTTQITGCCISMYLISPKMTLITLLVVPTLIIAGTLLGSILRRISWAAQDQMSACATTAEEALSNIRTVRSFAMEDVEVRQFEGESKQCLKKNLALGVGIGVLQSLSNFVLNGTVLAVVYGGTTLMARQELTPGDLMAFMVTVQTLQRSLAQVSQLFGQAIRGTSAAGRVFEYLAFVPEIPMSGGIQIPYHSFRGAVRFSDVQFSYPTRPEQKVLGDLTIDVRPGDVMAIVGSSGAGKSTIANLLERFYEVDEGCITIDDIDIRSLDPTWLRGHAIGYIAQEPVLFSGSIYDNIQYGKPDSTPDEVFKAAHQANAAEFIESFPQGYDTVVGERGVALSGGQKQRVAIARALIKEPRILILDEATSALDYQSEKIIQRTLEQAMEG